MLKSTTKVLTSYGLALSPSFHDLWIYSISIYYVPATVACAGDPEMNKTDEYICLHRPSIVVARPE